MEYCIWIVTPPGYIHSQAFDEIALGLQSAFSQLGYRVPIVKNRKEIAGRTIVLGCHLLPYLNRSWLPSEPILFNLEQIYFPSPWISREYLNLLKSYPVWDYSCHNIQALRKLGITRVTYCGIGYDPVLTKIFPKKEDIDILFYGSVNTRRRAILHELKKAGLRVKALFGAYGAVRDSFIARSKIVLNVHYYDARVFEMVRVSYLLANKKFVISEEGQDHTLEKTFRGGMIFSPYSKLVANCEKYLSEDEVRKDIAERGFKLIQEYPQATFLREALKLDNQQQL